jgi:aspartyl-tRNA(Asn)/glutamyl-tRNA(Gln) amidotransferase subunit C
MSVTPDDVRHVARLARLGLDDARVPSLVTELNGILAHMDVLQQIDITGVPLSPPHQGAPLRDDVLPSDRLQCEREDFAPATRDGFFLVPRLSTHGTLGASVSEDA